MFKILIVLCCTIFVVCTITINNINNEMDTIRQRDMIPTIQEELITTTTHISEIETFSIPKIPEYESSSQCETEVELACTVETETEIKTEVETEMETKIEVETTIETEAETETFDTTQRETTTQHEVTTEVSTTEPSYNVFDITDDEREILARIVYLEANIESFDCQAAIASVIFNRLSSGYWGNSLYDVLYAENQFSTIYNIDHVTPNEINYEAVDYVIQNGCTLPYYVMYFRAEYHFQWNGYVPYTVIDYTYFGYMANDK